MNLIIINGRFLVHKVTGVERYAKELIKELDNLVQPGQLEMAVPPEVINIPSYRNITVSYVGSLHNRFWEHISFPLYVIEKKGIALNFCNVAPLISPGIVCIHDLKIKAKPEYFKKLFLIWYEILFLNATKRSKEIFTVSQFSKSEIIKFYNVCPNKIHVVNASWQHFQKKNLSNEALKKYKLVSKKYYFSMSSIESNKNLKWIIEVAKKNLNEVFVVAGVSNATVFSFGEEFLYPSNMKAIGYISDEEAKVLMKECKAFLFPTFYEGFGLPPLEAYSVGANCVVVSDLEVMHEIYKDIACFVDPNKSDIDLNKLTIFEYEKINTLLNNYSWKKSALVLYNVLKTYLIMR